MSTKTFIHADNALARLKAEMSAEMQRAAEPAIQQAVAQAEKAIRERVGAMCIALIEKDFSVQRYGENLQITVRGFGSEK